MGAGSVSNVMFGNDAKYQRNGVIDELRECGRGKCAGMFGKCGMGIARPKRDPKEPSLTVKSVPT